MKKPWLAQISAGVMLTIATASAQSTTARVTKDVRFTMDDGIQIAADVYLPPSGSGPFPCLVELTPYRKETRAAEGASFLPDQGFALIEASKINTNSLSSGEERRKIKMFRLPGRRMQWCAILGRSRLLWKEPP